MAGGDHGGGAGGYCGGTGQMILQKSDNGLACLSGPTWGAGGSYFENGKIDSSRPVSWVGVFASKGGQGALTGDYLTCAGDGGIAGQGGIISVSQNAKVNAFNGNRYTDGTGYEDGKNQLEIFAQKGELRDVYKYSIFFESRQTNFNGKEFKYKDLFKIIFKYEVSKNIDEFIEKNENPVDNYLVRPATNCELSGYTNPITNNTQGIGSGAGYIELDNGSYTIDASLN